MICISKTISSTQVGGTEESCGKRRRYSELIGAFFGNSDVFHCHYDDDKIIEGSNFTVQRYAQQQPQAEADVDIDYGVDLTAMWQTAHFSCV